MAELPLSTTPRYVTIAKDALAVLREGLLVIGFLVLLLLPERFNGLLERAGFTRACSSASSGGRSSRSRPARPRGRATPSRRSRARLKDFDDRSSARSTGSRRIRA